MESETSIYETWDMTHTSVSNYTKKKTTHIFSGRTARQQTQWCATCPTATLGPHNRTPPPLWTPAKPPHSRGRYSSSLLSTRTWLDLYFVMLYWIYKNVVRMLCCYSRFVCWLFRSLESVIWLSRMMILTKVLRSKKIFNVRSKHRLISHDKHILEISDPLYPSDSVPFPTGPTTMDQDQQMWAIH